MALPYALVPSAPRVLLLDEAGGSNIWLARRKGAASVDVAQSNRVLLDLLAGPLREEGGVVFKLPGVSLHPVESRAFAEGTRDAFELIQLSGMESWSAAAGRTGRVEPGPSHDGGRHGGQLAPAVPGWDPATSPAAFSFRPGTTPKSQRR